MELFTIAVFLVITWGLGFSLTFWLKAAKDNAERNIMRAGVGLSAIPVLGSVLNLLHIPIDWRAFLLAGMIVPLYSLYSHRQGIAGFLKSAGPRIRITKSALSFMGVLLIFMLAFYTYHKGAFAYPWLEDDDSWNHALGAKYVALEKTADEPEGKSVLQYLDPYPPGYDILVGILHQTNSSVSWTLKYFNALIISLSLLFFYFFAGRFTHNRGKALFATFILAAVPPYFTHFIWAHSLVITIFIVLIYALQMLKKDKGWKYPAAVAYAGVLTTQPTQAIKVTLLVLIYMLIKYLVEKKHAREIIFSLAAGLALSLSWWATKWRGMLGVHLGPSDGPIMTQYTSPGLANKIISLMKTFAPVPSRIDYDWNSILYVSLQNKINIAVGLGLIVTLLAIFSAGVLLLNLIRKKHKTWRIITLVWLIVTLLGVFNLPFGLYGFRWWLLFCPFMAILCSEGMWFISRLLRKHPQIRVLAFLAVIVGVIATSAIQKYQINTVVWPASPGLMGYPDLIQGYSWLKTLPPDTGVFGYDGSNSGKIVGFDKYLCLWCDDEMEFYSSMSGRTPEEIASFLKSRGYAYLLLDVESFQKMGLNETNRRVNELLESGLYRISYQKPTILILSVN
ncbi:MAG: hypothetical protein ABH879_09850 [archaeon]